MKIKSLLRSIGMPYSAYNELFRRHSNGVFPRWTGQGNKREFSEAELLKLRVYAKLLRMGFRPKKIIEIIS